MLLDISSISSWMIRLLTIINKLTVRMHPSRTSPDLGKSWMSAALVFYHRDNIIREHEGYKPIHFPRHPRLRRWMQYRQSVAAMKDVASVFHRNPVQHVRYPILERKGVPQKNVSARSFRKTSTEKIYPYSPHYIEGHFLPPPVIVFTQEKYATCVLVAIINVLDASIDVLEFLRIALAILVVGLLSGEKEGF